MGINIGICETEAPSAPCRELRANIVKVHLDDPSGFEEYMEYDTKVDLDTAKKAVGDWDAFIKRNRINPETDAVYMDKVKKDDDRARTTTGPPSNHSPRGCARDGSSRKASPMTSGRRCWRRQAPTTGSRDGTCSASTR